MDTEEILNVVWKNLDYGSGVNWTDEQIGEFVRRALTEDIDQYDLEKEVGLNRVRE